MIAVVATDAAITPPMLPEALPTAMRRSFNNLTVDGDMCTNDAVFALANGLARNPPIADPGRRSTRSPRRSPTSATELAREIAADGEGATKLLEVTRRAARPTRTSRATSRRRSPARRW